MSTPLSIAVVGFWHVHADDYAAEIVAHPQTTITAVYDPDPEVAEAAAERWAVEAVTDLDALLARDDLDGITVTTATTAHVDVISRAIAAGKHVFTEKLLAPTVEECERLIAAAEAAGVALVVSLPRLNEAATLAAERELASGALGSLTYSRVRLAHDGWISGFLPERFAVVEDAVGGALADLGCHAVYLTRLFHGADPVSVQATYQRFTGRALEDNAVVTAEYGDGAIGVMESSFVTTPGAYAFELRGTEGSLVFGFGGGGLLAKGTGYDPEAWTEVVLPPDDPTPFAAWVEQIRLGTRDPEHLTTATAVTHVVEAANRSASTGVSVPLETVLTTEGALA